MEAVAELVDRAVAAPPGPELATLLSRLPWKTIPNSRLVEVLQARSRQRAHEDAQWLAGIAEIAHTVALEEVPGDRAGAVLRAGEASEWASHEIAAALTWTPTAADRELGVALGLIERLPLVYAALYRGEIDRGKARVFLDYLDPATGDVSEEQARRLCERFLPAAPGLTTRQLGDRIYRALHAIDPHYRRRRYRRAVQERGVALYLDPATGTATLAGTGLPADEAVAAAERLDRLAEAVTRAGHPGTRRRISADLFLGMLNGAFHGLREDEIIARLRGTSRPEDVPEDNSDTPGSDDSDDSDDTAGTGDTAITHTGTAGTGTTTGTATTDTATTDTATTGTATTDTATTDTGAAGTGAAGTTAARTPAAAGVAAAAETTAGASAAGTAAAPATTEPDTAAASADTATDAGTDTAGTAADAGATATARATADGPATAAADTENAAAAGAGTAEAAATGAAAAGAGAAGAGAATPPGADGAPGPDRWAREPVGVREGVEIRLGLATLAGLDDRPGEIPRIGPIGAQLARAAVAAQRRGAAWRFALVDDTGHLVLAGVLRRRPRTRPVPGGPGPGRVRGGVVEVHLTVEELRRFAADPALGRWHGMLAEIADQWARRDTLRARLAAHPDARFARGPLADHIRARDRYCCGPGCTRSARACDLDHTRDHGRGGKTVEANIGPGCHRHHPDKDRGWTLTQPEPGLFRWRSPLGRIYLTRGEPIRPDLPDPDPAPHPREESDAQVERRLRRYDRKILDPPTAGPARPPPPPRPGPGRDDEPPPF